jgi:hypothetical protein
MLHATFSVMAAPSSWFCCAAVSPQGGPPHKPLPMRGAGTPVLSARPAFYAEAHRVLVPGGMLAIVEYVRTARAAPPTTQARLGLQGR